MDYLCSPTSCLLQKGVSDWHLAIVILVITAVGTLIPVVGWAIPLLRSVPSLELDLERGPDRDVRNHGLSSIHNPLD